MDNEPGEERLVADWTLTLEDMFEVEKCRGEANRRWFAVQLCYLRNEGSFLEDVSDFPLEIINFISLQLGFVPVLLMTDPGRGATTSSYRFRLQNYLGVQNLTDEIETHLRNLLKQEAVSGKSEKEMIKTARFYLRERKVLLPKDLFFTKMIRESLLFAQADIFTEVADLLSDEVGTELEKLLEVENNRSRLFDLKEYPPKATSRSTLKYLEKYHFVNTLAKNKIDLSSINPQVIKNLAGVCKRYNVWQLKRFSPPKKRALLFQHASKSYAISLQEFIMLSFLSLKRIIKQILFAF